MTGCAIPAAALAQHIAVLGKTGSGKTYTVRGIVEGLLDQKARLCVIDPTGVWYGLRTLADGKRAGYPVVIFGGSHGDFPLSGHHGADLAEIVGTSSTPAIIDTSALRTGERTRLFTDFAEELLRKNRGPLHLVIDEAHLFAPQGRVADPQSGAMLHAANNLVSLGRSRGLRIVLITQRPAKLHKDSLTQVETLVALRLIAPQDRRAVEDWIEDNADDAQGKAVLSSLASLKTGTGWVWSPEAGVLERVAFPKIRTLDSGRAPDGSEIEGRVLAAIDRDAIAARLKTVAQEAIDNDPKRLRARIAELERQAKQGPSPAIAEADAQRRYADGHGVGFAEGYRQALSDAERSVRDALNSQLAPILASALNLLGRGVKAPPAQVAVHAKQPIAPATQKALTEMVRAAAQRGGTASLSKAERLVLTALAQHPHGRTRVQVAILTGYAHNGGGFNNALSALRTKGFIHGSGDRLTITPAGADALGPVEPLPSGRELADYWLRQLSKAERRALEELIAVYPAALSKDDLADRAGYEANGGGFNNALSRLRTLELISGRGEIRASEVLFA